MKCCDSGGLAVLAMGLIPIQGGKERGGPKGCPELWACMKGPILAQSMLCRGGLSGRSPIDWRADPFSPFQVLQVSGHLITDHWSDHVQERPIMAASTHPYGGCSSLHLHPYKICYFESACEPLIQRYGSSSPTNQWNCPSVSSSLPMSGYLSYSQPYI